MTLRRYYAILITFILILFFVVACESQREGGTPLPDGTYPVDRLFAEYYEALGGVGVFGPAITPIFENDGGLFQYTDRALLMYDRNQPHEQRLRLGPLGRDLGIFELPPGGEGTAPGEAVMGYTIFEHFKPLYERLGGEQVVGKPLTAAHKNLDKNRYEQHFENLGFYWVDGSPPETAGLLSYGAWRCDYRCRHVPPENSRIQAPTRKVMSFALEVARQGLDFTGYARTEPAINASGLLEQVYDNVALVADPQQPEEVHLLPLPELLGMGDPSLQTAQSDPNSYFYPLQDGLGYNVPIFFMEYISQHGGLEHLGAPISPLTQPEAGLYRQCFRNICLQARAQADGSLDIRPEPLGVQYAQRSSQPAVTPVATTAAVDIAIQVWEEHPLVSPSQEQVIGVLILGNNLPLAEVQPELELVPPDGSPTSYILPPSGGDGETQIRIPPLGGKNGTIIPYKICVASPTSQKFCVLDSYLIWYTEVVAITPLAPEEHTSYLPFVFRTMPVYVPALLDTHFTFIPIITRGE